MRGADPAARITGVIVLYLPGPAILDHLRNVQEAVDSLVVVINGGEIGSTAEALRASGAVVISNDRNLGLATALNQGIDRAFADDTAGFVLLLDQDSRPPPDMAYVLRDTYADAAERGANPACVGPRLAEVKGRPGTAYGRRRAASAAQARDSVATSGSLIGRDAFRAVGPMRDDLFIDGIDHEWCFRARSLGYQIVQDPVAWMSHDMGEAGVVLLGRYRPVYRSPIRHHFIVRNTVFLLRTRYAPLRWKLREAVKTLYRIPVYLYLSGNRSASLSGMFSGVREGMRMSVATTSRD